MFCAPHVKPRDGTCYTRAELEAMARDYNRYQAKTRTDRIDTKLKKKTLLRELMKRSRCRNEWCLAEQEYIKDGSLINNFRPLGPQKKYAWLSTDDIHNVLKQYEYIKPNFVFFGPVPMDFCSVKFQEIRKVCEMDIKDLYHQGKTKIGVVFNTDPHTRGGKHWISMFIDLNPRRPEINYFDSYAKCPPAPEVVHLVEKLKESGKGLFKKPFTYRCNARRHQFGYSECGVYSIYFIVSRLRGRSFEDVCNDIVDDETMNSYRRKFFRPE